MFRLDLRVYLPLSPCPPLPARPPRPPPAIMDLLGVTGVSGRHRAPWLGANQADPLPTTPRILPGPSTGVSPTRSQPGLERPPRSPTSHTSRTEGTCGGGGGFIWGRVCVGGSVYRCHTETRAHQELGLPPWLWARPSQGDLFAKAPRPAAPDEMCPCAAPPGVAWAGGGGGGGRGSPARGTGTGPGLGPWSWGGRGAPGMSFARNGT